MPHKLNNPIDAKEIGIAIYLSKNEDILSIKKKVGYYPDFIHFDLVDQSFNPKAKTIDITKGYEAQKNWPRLMKMSHIMSKFPSRWIKNVSLFSDYIVVHVEIEENLDSVINKIKRLNKKIGISIMYSTPLEKIIEYLDRVDLVQMLGIKKPGESGQHMETDAIQRLNKLSAI